MISFNVKGKQKSQSKMSSFIDEISSFCNETSAHGFKYLHKGESSGPLTKLIWFILIILGFLLVGVIVYSLVLDWNDNPVITTIDTTEFPITNIQFPTITICPSKLCSIILTICIYYDS